MRVAVAMPPESHMPFAWRASGRRASVERHGLARRECRLVVASVGVDHMGLCVRDLQASLAFYTEVAGFTVRMAPRRIAGEWFDTLTRNRGADIEVAMIELGSFTLQLVQYHAAGAPPISPGHNHPGNPHLSINVVDIDTRHAEVVASG